MLRYGVILNAKLQKLNTQCAINNDFSMFNSQFDKSKNEFSWNVIKINLKNVSY